MNSAQSSQSTTPVHEPRDGRAGSGRFYVATPDLLSSDTDVTSPENHVSSAAYIRSGAAENGSMMYRRQPDDERMSEMSRQSSNQVDDTKVADVSDQLSTAEPQYYSTSQAPADHRPQPAVRSLFTLDVPDRHEMTLDKDGSRPVDNRGPGFRFRAADPPSDHQRDRDSSPINRLAGLFKNLAKF